MNDKLLRLLLDLWMWHDGLDDIFGERLNDVVQAECTKRGVEPAIAYHELKVSL